MRAPLTDYAVAAWMLQQRIEDGDEEPCDACDPPHPCEDCTRDFLENHWPEVEDEVALIVAEERAGEAGERM